MHDSLSLSCQAYGEPLPTVKWMRGHTQLTPEHNDTLLYVNNVLRLTDVTQSEEYTCAAENEMGSVEQTVLVMVEPVTGKTKKKEEEQERKKERKKEIIVVLTPSNTNPMKVFDNTRKSNMYIGCQCW